MPVFPFLMFALQQPSPRAKASRYKAVNEEFSKVPDRSYASLTHFAILPSVSTKTICQAPRQIFSNLSLTNPLTRTGKPVVADKSLWAASQSSPLGNRGEAIPNPMVTYGARMFQHSIDEWSWRKR